MANEPTYGVPQSIMSDAQLKTAVDGAVQWFSPSNPENRTEKNIRDWTTADLKKVGPRDLRLLANYIAYERPAISDKIIPNGLSREDFYRALNREMARRDIAKNEFVNDVLPPPSNSQQIVEVTRAAYKIGAPQTAPASVVRKAAGILVLHDMAVDAFVNNQDYLRVQNDLADALKIKQNWHFTFIHRCTGL